jgi:hypothetical protein
MKRYGYTLFTLCLMVIFPILFAVLELTIRPGHTSLLEAFGRWFVFWGVGVRLFVAGIRQIIAPALTSEGILGIKGKAVWQIVRELGFTNLGIGLVAIASFWVPNWTYAAALAGGIFLTFAGIEHIRKKQRTFDESVAMITDLFVGVIALVYVIVWII